MRGFRGVANSIADEAEPEHCYEQRCARPGCEASTFEPVEAYNELMAAMRAQPASRIVRNARILGGVPIIQGTRVPVRAIAFLWRATGDRARILRDYPSLGAQDVDEAIRYYEAHRAELDADLREELGDEV